MADIQGIPNPIPFNKDGKANLISISKLYDQGFRTYMDADIEPAMFIENKKCGIVSKFSTSKNELFL